jgi:hypothetical protein
MSSIPRLIQIMREEGAALNEQIVLLGEVTSINPLIINTNEIDLDEDELKTINTLTFELNDEVFLLKMNKFYYVIGIVRDVS